MTVLAVACGAENEFEPVQNQQSEMLDPPGQPTNPPTSCSAHPIKLSLTPGSSQMYIDMTSTCNKVKWTVQRQQDDNTWATIGSGSSLPNDYTDTDVEPQVEYCYRAISKIGTSTATGPVACASTTVAAPSMPAFDSLKSGTENVTIGFTGKSTNEDEYRIFRRTGDETWKLVATIPTTNKLGTGDSYAYVDTPPKASGTHCYIVGAKNAGGGSPWAAERCTVLQHGSPAPQAAAEWHFTADTAGELGSLRNDVTDECLEYVEWMTGINLDYWDCGGPEVKFVRAPQNSTAPLVYGERLAVHFKGGGYLEYGTRIWGINLDWSSTPEYEWEIVTTDPAKGGQPLDGKAFALKNTYYGDFLVWKDRDGVNLGWYQSTIPAPTSEPYDDSDTILLKAQPPQQGGYLLFIGQTLVKGELKAVQVPNQQHLIGFFFLKPKPGLQNADCAKAQMTDVANVGVWVPANQTMSSTQKTALWGTAAPATPLAFAVCPVYTQVVDYTQLFLNLTVSHN